MSETFDIDLLKNLSIEIVFSINEQDWDSVKEIGTDSFKTSFTEEYITVNTKSFLEQAGKQKFIKNIFFSESIDQISGKAIGIVIIQVKYEKKTICYTFNFNDEKKLVGFFLK